MLVKGHWEIADDGGTRPVVNIGIQTADGDWEKASFLLDAGADCTVISAELLPLLASLVLPDDAARQLGGVGGRTEGKLIQTKLAFTRDDGSRVTVNGPFAIFTDVESSDISILGRDVTNNFHVIYSYRKGEVLLLAPPHDYVVQLPF